ncbi:methyl-accepting chemotaxis protein [Cytobacillus firmus]|uniref:Methyl-accepting chemotaxis sensory transducer n=2 Tax=Cytobacillus firmus TaxID=1399 RepID=W7KZW3_CYTFI|nr:methyl-accepting chemotaxis protein [Cytobacillus firmus]EWG12895.1 methyl-accepting chemotaxis sensory transducer [Cytobacillus firmus DS1]
MSFKFKLGTKINLIVISIVLLLSVIIGGVVVNEVTKGIKAFAIEKAKGDLSLSERYIRNKFPGEWEIRNGKLYRGDHLFNNDFELVDAIGQDTGDSVTIFQGDTRITTNVFVNGERNIGTAVSPEVGEVVLKKGEKYYGEAKVTGNTFQTAYMPLKNKSGETVGILYVGAPQTIIDKILSDFMSKFLILILIVAAVASLVVFWFTKRLQKRLAAVKSALELAGRGDFTAEVIDDAGDELTDLSKSYNEMKENLITMIREVLGTSDQVAASSEELTAGAEQTSKATEQITEAIQQVAGGAEIQTQSIEESAKALEELTSGIAAIAESSAEIAENTAEVGARADEGGKYVEQTSQQMTLIHTTVIETSKEVLLLNERSKQIENISKVIIDIASQTNLLALNAAIEAARAGEHGKGFAVVADEVRKLAEQSQESSSQISELIRQIQNDMNQSTDSMNSVKREVENGLGIVSRTQKSFEVILRFMMDIGLKVDGMAATAQQMSASTQEISAAVTGVTAISRESSMHSQGVAASAEEQLASMEEVSASAHNLSEMAEQLQDTVSRFKF